MSHCSLSLSKIELHSMINDWIISASVFFQFKHLKSSTWKVTVVSYKFQVFEDPQPWIRVFTPHHHTTLHHTRPHHTPPSSFLLFSLLSSNEHAIARTFLLSSTFEGAQDLSFLVFVFVRVTRELICIRNSGFFPPSVLKSQVGRYSFLERESLTFLRYMCGDLVWANLKTPSVFCPPVLLSN